MQQFSTNTQPTNTTGDAAASAAVPLVARTNITNNLANMAGGAAGGVTGKVASLVASRSGTPIEEAGHGGAAALPFVSREAYEAAAAAEAAAILALPHASTVAPYVDEIIGHLLRREQSVARDPNYLSGQPDVTDRMRTILNDWLVDVAIKFKVHPETFFLAVNIVDRYLMRAHVSRSQLQLVGVTAMLLAAKHEEIWAPEVKECIYISANTYTAEEVITMERSIAAELNFRFTVPTQYPFLCNILDRLRADRVTRNCALFFLDCSALEYRMLEFYPSQVAAAACFLSLLTVFNGMPLDHWLNHFENASYVPIAAAVDCAAVLLQTAKSLAASGSRFQAVRRKFSSSKYDGVALMAMPEAVPEIIFQ